VHHSLSLGNNQILVMGRLRIPVAVLSATTLVKPSFPVSMSLITTFFHTRGGGVNCLLSQALVHQFEHLAEYFSIYFSVGVDEDSHGTSVSTIVESSAEHTTILTSDLRANLVNYDLGEPIMRYQ